MDSYFFNNICNFNNSIRYTIYGKIGGGYKITGSFLNKIKGKEINE